MALTPQTPPKPLPRWVWIVAGFFLFSVVSFLIFLFVSEGIGKTAWEQYKTEWEANGEVFDWAAYIPPEIPDDENFAMAPVMQDLKGVDALGLQNIPGFVASEQVGWQRGQAHDLTQHFPTLSTEEAWTLIAKQIEDRAELLSQLSEAAQRPKCRFPLDYAAGMTATNEPVMSTFRLSSIFIFRSLWHKAQQDTTRALADWSTAFRLSECVGDAPNLLSYLMQTGAFSLSTQPIWEMLHEHLLDESQLQAIREVLADRDLIADFLTHLRQERAMFVHAIDQLILNNITMAHVTGTASPMFSHYPKGWWYEDKRTYCDRLAKSLLYPNGIKAVNTIDLAHCRQFDKALQDENSRGIGRFLPKNLMSNISAISTSHFARNALAAEALLRQLRLALALESHYLNHDRFPASLSDLAPDYLEAIPVDTVNQQPFIYRLESEGQGYLLYSVAADGEDNGGVNADSKTDGPGDWVWPMPGSP